MGIIVKRMKSADITDEGARLLACAVVGRAVEDYRKLEKSKGPRVKVDGAWLDRETEMASIMYFLREAGGAQEYLDLARVDVTPEAVVRRL